MVLRPSCSFCGKSQDEVARLIAGPSVFICNRCVELCVDILGENPPRPSKLGAHEALAESPPAPEPLGPHHVLVQVPDGSVHACERESEWAAFEQRGEHYEWCVTRGHIRGDLPFHVVAVRRVDSGRPARGTAFPLDTKLTDEHARRVVDAMWAG